MITKVGNPHELHHAVFLIELSVPLSKLVCEGPTKLQRNILEGRKRDSRERILDHDIINLSDSRADVNKYLERVVGFAPETRHQVMR